MVVGAGYIAVELAGIFGSLGAKTSILIRYDQVLYPLIQSKTGTQNDMIPLETFEDL